MRRNETVLAKVGRTVQFAQLTAHVGVHLSIKRFHSLPQFFDVPFKRLRFVFVQPERARVSESCPE